MFIVYVCLPQSLSNSNTSRTFDEIHTLIHRLNLITFGLRTTSHAASLTLTYQHRKWRLNQSSVSDFGAVGSPHDRLSSRRHSS